MVVEYFIHAEQEDDKTCETDLWGQGWRCL